MDEFSIVSFNWGYLFGMLTTIVVSIILSWVNRMGDPNP